jgi:hypothetical protein
MAKQIYTHAPVGHRHAIGRFEKFNAERSILMRSLPLFERLNSDHVVKFRRTLYVKEGVISGN